MSSHRILCEDRTLEPRCACLPESDEAYLKDPPSAEIHWLNAGQFATEDNLPYIAEQIVSFYDKHVKPKPQ